MQSLHVHRLEIEDFKRIEAATLAMPEGGGVFEICGENGAGKSSTIDALWAAIGGATVDPKEPIRKGAKSAMIEVDLGDIVVRREYGPGTHKLHVVGRDGKRVNSPQTLLKSLFDKFAFDPLEFTRKEPRHQAEILRKMVGLDFTAINARRAELVDERKQLDRAIKSQEVQLGEMPEVEKTEEVSASDLQAKLAAANKHNTSVDQILRMIDRKYDQIGLIEREIKEVEAKLTDLKERLATAECERAALARDWSPVKIDTAPILAEIVSIEQTNQRARHYRDREALVANINDNRHHFADLGLDIEHIDDERRRMLADAPWPISGLGLDEDGITFRGVPFTQASTSEQIRICLAILATLEPKLRSLAIREGSLLDDASLELIGRWAVEHGYQVFVERVAKSPHGRGIVIEEGRVAGATGVEASSSPKSTAAETLTKDIAGGLF